MTSVTEAVDQLAQSQRGRRALADIDRLLADYWLGLDAFNQAAVLTLLEHAWASPMSTRDAIAEAELHK